jgi:hypothetical protein
MNKIDLYDTKDETERQNHFNEKRRLAIRAAQLERAADAAQNPGWRLVDLPLFGPTKVPDGVEVHFVPRGGVTHSEPFARRSDL